MELGALKSGRRSPLGSQGEPSSGQTSRRRSLTCTDTFFYRPQKLLPRKFEQGRVCGINAAVRRNCFGLRRTISFGGYGPFLTGSVGPTRRRLACAKQQRGVAGPYHHPQRSARFSTWPSNDPIRPPWYGFRVAAAGFYRGEQALFSWAVINHTPQIQLFLYELAERAESLYRPTFDRQPPPGLKAIYELIFSLLSWSHTSSWSVSEISIATFPTPC